jgi:hypothetical protein
MLVAVALPEGGDESAAPVVEIDEISSRRGFDLVVELLGDANVDGARIGDR